MDDLQELRAALQKALRGETKASDDLLDRYDAALAHEHGEKIRKRAERETLPYREEFKDAVWQGLHRAADIIDPDGAE